MIKVRCPICQRLMQGQGPKDWPEWPFYTARCRLIDLGRWLGEAYRVAPMPAEDAPVRGGGTDPPKPAVPSAVPHREEA